MKNYFYLLPTAALLISTVQAQAVADGRHTELELTGENDEQ